MIRADANFIHKKAHEHAADCNVAVSGNAELIAVEYSAITYAIMKAEGGQAIIDRAMDILKQQVDEKEN